MRSQSSGILRSHWRKACAEREDGPNGAQKSLREADAGIVPAHKDLSMKGNKGWQALCRVSGPILYTQSASVFQILTYLL